MITENMWPYQDHHNEDETICPLCGHHTEDMDIGGEDWFDDLMDHLVYHKCSADEELIVQFLNDTDPDGDLYRAYKEEGW